MRIDWTDEQRNRVIELRKTNHTWQEISERMTKEYGENFTVESCRNQWRNRNKKKTKKTASPKQYKTTIKRNKDGTRESDRLIAISETEMKDDSYILKAHGYDDSWEIVEHTFSMWNHFNKELTSPKTLYASRIRVKQKEKGLTDEQLAKIITEETKPLQTDTFNYKIKDKRILEIPLMDMHFGINTLDDYKKTIKRLEHHLTKRVWEQVIITFGSDLMHVDNLKNTTANGTRIQDVDVEQMINDVKRFYEWLVSLASKQSNKVKVYYIKGNHDETTSGLLIHWLNARFKDVANIEVDKSIEEVKMHSWEKIFIALTHGDKGGRRTRNTLSSKYPVEWAKAKVREFHKGHEHHEQVKCEFGVTERTLPTGAKIDGFHKDNSYDSAHRRFQIFEYSNDWLESIHYV